MTNAQYYAVGWRRVQEALAKKRGKIVCPHLAWYRGRLRCMTYDKETTRFYVGTEILLVAVSGENWKTVK